MLVLRKEQVDQLQQAAKGRCAGAILVSLGGFSSPLFKNLEEAQRRAVIRFGMDRAEPHGLITRDPVRLYLELMLLLGSQFDTLTPNTRGPGKYSPSPTRKPRWSGSSASTRGPWTTGRG